MSNQLNNLNPNLSIFQIVDSRSGNIAAPQFKKEGSELKFNFHLREEKLVEVKLTSTTFCKNFFYELVSRANYQLESFKASSFQHLSNDELTDMLTILAQQSLKRHSLIFRQFNSAGTFKSCTIDERSFEDLRSNVSEMILSIKAASKTPAE